MLAWSKITFAVKNVKNTIKKRIFTLQKDDW
jgi:hypothetical protein